MFSTSSGGKKDVEFAQQQNSLFGKLLTVRISLQTLLDQSNRLPVLPFPSPFDEETLDEAENPYRSGLHVVLGDMLDMLNLQASEEKLVGKKRRREDSTPISWEEVVAPQEKLRPEWETVVNKWHARNHFGSEQKKSKLKVFNTTIWDQIDDILMDERRIIEKSRMPMEDSERKRIESGVDASDADSIPKVDEYDLEVYDDRQFYSQLLKSFITASTSGGSSIGGLAAESMRAEDFAALKKIRKSKSKVDRKASKGRKIRYVPHDKLKNFMFPIPYPESSIDADRLFTSLFQ